MIIIIIIIENFCYERTDTLVVNAVECWSMYKRGSDSRNTETSTTFVSVPQAPRLSSFPPEFAPKH